MMQSDPVISVIIPAYFSFTTIHSCLQSLREQSFQDFEIIVVNSSPEEKTQLIVHTYFPEVFFIQSEQRLLPHAARNKGAELAKGSLLVFTDPDCIAAKDWLQKLVYASRQGNDIIAGGMDVINRTWMETGIHLQKFYWCLAGSTKKYLPDVATANACYKKEIWNKLGPFNPEIFSGDTLLAWRARENNIRIRFVPEAVVKHNHETTVSKFLKERFFRGREFTVTRTKFKNWSKARSLIYFIATPLNLIIMLLKAGKDAFKSGFGKEFLITFPLQILGHSAWLSGEAVAHTNNFLRIKK